MKRLIWLLPYDYNPDNKKLKQIEIDKLVDKMSSDCIKQFKIGIKQHLSWITILKEYPGAKPSVLIDFPSEKETDIYNEMVNKIGTIIETIDNVLPLEDQEGRPKEKSKKKELDLSKFLK